MMAAAIALGGYHNPSSDRAAGTWFDQLEFLPTVTKEMVEENHSLLVPTFLDFGRWGGDVHSELCHQDAASQQPHRRLCRQAAPGVTILEHVEQRPFREEPDDGGIDRRRHRLCDVHTSAPRPRWLEHGLESGRWVPTFPKARYIIADRELAYWTQREKENPSSRPWITESVLPIVAAKRTQIVKSDFAFGESAQFIPTPRHSIDHFSVLIGRPGADVLIVGDLIHSPLQGKYPKLGVMSDYDSAQAGQTRPRIFNAEKKAARAIVARSRKGGKP
jgi:hypothetical protein